MGITDSRQCAHSILMVKPRYFGFNTETAKSNIFQNKEAAQSDIADVAMGEFQDTVRLLSNAGVDIVVIEPFAEGTPDAVFPNNWFSTHADGSIVYYPMLAENRRKERSVELPAVLRDNGFSVGKVIDLSPMERVGGILEGTGSMILDREARIAYVAESSRATRQTFEPFEKRTGYEIISFGVSDSKGREIYHTNVLMSVGSKVAVLNADAFTEPEELTRVEDKLRASMKTIIRINEEQMLSFCGNILEVKAHDGESLFIMSHTAYRAFLPKQREILNLHGRIVPVAIPTIEKVGGGSIRCMMAEIFLPKAKNR